MRRARSHGFGTVPRGIVRLVLLTGLCVPALARATPPRGPAELRVLGDATALHWELLAHRDVVLLAAEIRTVPPRRVDLSWHEGQRLLAGMQSGGAIALGAGCRWLQMRVHLRTARGEEWVVGSWGEPPSPGQPRLAVRQISKTATAPTAGHVRARFLYEDRLLGLQGYTGTTRQLPLRHVDVELVGEADQVLARGALSATGELLLPLPETADGAFALRLWSSTRQHPDFDLAVVEREDENAPFRRHALETPPFTAAAGGVDLGTFVLDDPDGFGRLQAFHVLDVALDAFRMLATPEWLGKAPRDSLRFVWGPAMRLRATASAGSFIQLASPAGGDTDGWSDAVILHEVAHFVARRYGRDDSSGGLHFLGDVEQNLTLAFSEGWATAFAAQVQAWRATQHPAPLDGPAPAPVSWYIDAGMPPPLGTAGGLQLGWNLETSTWLDGRPLVRDGIGSESNVASVLWDLVDDEATFDGSPGLDDDPGSVGVAAWWSALREMRGLPAEKSTTLEDYWLQAQSQFGDAAMRLALQVFLEHGRIEFVRDAAEPDDTPASAPEVAVGHPAHVPGGVVIDEIDPGTSPAVEISNRGGETVFLQGWLLHARRNGATTNPGLTLRFPPGLSLTPGARLVVHDAGRPDDATLRHFIAPHWSMPWFPESDGALILVDPQGRTRDFVRWSSRRGEPSQTAVPGDTDFHGELVAPGFGRTLQRLAHADTDQAGDFVVAASTLGAPNDVDVVHRTFYPAGDRDTFRFVARRDGTFTLQTLGLRNGAEPHVRLSARGRPPLVPLRRAPDGAVEVTLRLQAGEEIRAELEHRGERTRFGSYDLAVYADPASRAPHPPEGIRVETGEVRGLQHMEFAWWNAAPYDSLTWWLDGTPARVVAGAETQGTLEVAPGVHRLQLQAHVDGLTAWGEPLSVQVGPLPKFLAEDFEYLSNDIWEVQSPWGLAPAPGRPGLALTESPDGPYDANLRITARLLQSFEVREGTTLCFDHICIVRPGDVAAVQVSNDWGAHWETLGRWDRNAHRGEGESSNWSDGEADGTDWVHECLPLDSDAGRAVQVRFFFESDVFGSAAGWWIDALHLGEPASAAPRFRLDAAVPNPFNARTRLRFEVPQPGLASLRLFDVRGRLVRVLLQEPLDAGEHTVFWDGAGPDGIPMASGIYFVQLHSGAGHAERKIVLLR